MLEDPGLATELEGGLRAGYGIEASGFTFVPGYDMRAASYEVASADGRWFAKVHLGRVDEAPLMVPRALLDAGITNVLAPIRTLMAELWHPMADDRALVLFPFVAGRNAMEAGMSADQWRTFGAALRSVHGSGLEVRFADRLPAETFALPSAALVQAALALRPGVRSAAADRMRALLQEHAGRIGAMLERAGEVGTRLGRRALERVLCHADIHAANILVADDGGIFMVDWDGPRLAPRERDLLFVIGSRIARDVEPLEEAWFFEGYGDVEVDQEALVYFRFERILEDIGEFASSVMTDADVPEASRESQVGLFESFFRSGGSVEAVEKG